MSGRCAGTLAGIALLFFTSRLQAATPTQIGVFQSGIWFVDSNNDHSSANDPWFFLGQAGDIPVVGDWDNTGVLRVGVFRNGQWWLDMNNDYRWDSVNDVVFTYGQAGDIPVIGNWDPNHPGQARIGVFRNGVWFLNENGDHVTSNAYSFGVSTDIPVVGDWGSGTLRMGVFRNGTWFVDADGSHSSQHAVYFVFGQSGDIPVMGDWTGSGHIRIGVFRGGAWFVDVNGDHNGFNAVYFGYGQGGQVPVVGGSWHTAFVSVTEGPAYAISEPAGTPQQFTVHYTNPFGASDVAYGQNLFNSDPNGPNGNGACQIEWNSAGALNLLSPSGSSDGAFGQGPSLFQCGLFD